MSRFRAVVVGCGFIGSRAGEGPSFDPHMTHAAACAAHPAVDLAGLCDPDPARARDAASYWNTKAFGAPEVMLREVAPDIVCIAAPTLAHAELLRLALATPSVRGIFCEKPLTEDLEESRLLVAQARDKGIALGINYLRRYDAGHWRAKALLDEGRLGKILMARGLYVRGVLHNGSHMIDLLRWLLGEVRFVRAEPDPQASPDRPLSGVLELEGGVPAHLQGVAMANADTLFDVDILGEAGRLVFTLNGNDIRLLERAESQHYQGFYTPNLEMVVSSGIRGTGLAAIDNLIDCMEKGGVPYCTGADGVRAMEVAEALVRSARSGEREVLS